jgi:hypothetical protein
VDFGRIFSQKASFRRTRESDISTIYIQEHKTGKAKRILLCKEFDGRVTINQENIAVASKTQACTKLKVVLFLKGGLYGV